MINPARWSLALGATLALSVGTLAPALVTADAVAAPAWSSVSAPATKTSFESRWHTRTATAARDLGLDRSPARLAVQQAINPDDYTCGSTDLDPYIASLLKDMSPSDIEFLLDSGALDIPTYDALFFGSDTDPRYALPADYRTDLEHTFRDARRFWDIKSGDIQLHAMHGSMLTDPARVARVLRVFGFSQEDAADFARVIARRVAATPAFQGGDNPIFTLNAFAFTASEESNPELFEGVPDKLIFGDGILDAFEALHMTDVAPRAVLAHEFAHHVQFEDHLFDSPLTGAEATRRTELMADGMGTYFLTHSRGLALNKRRVLEAEKSFYEVGDCAFTDPNHHGTPNQRLRASQWGAQLASSAQKQGHILPSLRVARLFDQALPAIVAPDAS